MNNLEFVLTDYATGEDVLLTISYFLPQPQNQGWRNVPRS